MSRDWSDWNDTPFRREGRRCVYIKGSNPERRHIEQAEAMLACLETGLLSRPIAEILRPSQTAKKWCAGRGLIEVPNPTTPRQAAVDHSNGLSHWLEYAHAEFVIACRLEKIKDHVFGYWGGWGDEPEGLIVKILPPDDLSNRLSLLSVKIRQVSRAIRRRQKRLRFALHQLEAHRPGEVFRCHDPDLRYLTQEPSPLITKASRDDRGVWWELHA